MLPMLRFDVGKQRYTTDVSDLQDTLRLRFDVGKQRYTTIMKILIDNGQLRFDVGKQRYTTYVKDGNTYTSCGLM